MEIINLRDVPHFIPTIADWHHAEWGHLNPGQTLEGRIEKMQKYLDDNLVPTMFVGVEGDEILGTAAFVKSDMNDCSYQDLTPWLASVYVREDLRGRGLGKQLVQAIMDYAGKQGVATLYLYTPDQAPFYQKLGWEIYAEDTYHDTAVTVMQLKY